MIRLFQQDSRATKLVFGVVIGFAILAMIVALVPGIFDNGTAGNSATYATVRSPSWYGRITGDTVAITNAEVENSARAQLRQQGMPEMYLPYILARAGQQQVERAVLVREADHLGLQVANEDLQRELKTGPLSQYLFPGGEFIGLDKYQDFVQKFFGISVVQFESEVKQDLELQRLEALVTGGVSVSETAARAAYLKQGEKVKFDYAVISAADVKKNINPSESELQTYFTNNAAKYATAVPEERRIEFFSVDASNLPGGVPKVSDAEIGAYYSAHAADYKVPEEVKTRHILITVPKGADPKTDAAAKAKAEALRAQIAGGASLAELAKTNSDDPGSKAQGGELPMIPTSSLDPSYARAAMALSPGQTSGVVRSQFGYHIIQTEQKDTAHTRNLAEVKDDIAGKLSAQKFAQAQSNFANQLAADAKKNGMDATAKAHNVPVTTTDFLGRNGTVASLPDSASLLSAAFGTAKGAAPAAVSTGEGYAIFQVADIKAAHAPLFADWKGHVLDDYRDERAPALMNSELKKLDDLARQRGDLHKAAAEMNLPVKTSDFVGHDGQVADLGPLSGDAAAIFTLPQGGISGPLNLGSNGVASNGAVAQVLDKHQPTADDMAQHVGPARDKLIDQQRAEVFNVFAGTLMDRYQRAGAIVYSRKPTGPPQGS